MSKEKTEQIHQVTLELDEKDFQHLMGAIRRREIMGCAHIHPHDMPIMPDGQGNREGRILAEICRGWAEAVTGWKWMNGEPMNPDERMRLRKEAG